MLSWRALSEVFLERAGGLDSREVQTVSGRVYRGDCGFLDLFVGIQRHPTWHRDGRGGCSLGGETGRNEEGFRVVNKIMGTKSSEVESESNKGE